MQFSDLDTFLTVSRERNFSRAAERLFRTQPAVSIAVRRLEDWAGQPLFERGSREVKLTDAGELMIEYAERILNLREESRKGLVELADLERGRLTLAVNESWIHALLPTLAEYRRLHPEVQIAVHRTFSRDIPRAVLNYQLDLGVISYRPEDEKLEVVEFFEDSLTFVVSPGHRLARRKAVDISELGGETFAAHIVPSHYRQRVIDQFGESSVPLHMTIQLPTIESIKRFVQMSMGVAIIPRTCVSWELEQEVLAEVEVKQLKMKRTLYLVFRRGSRLSHSALELLRLLGVRQDGRKVRPKRTKN